MVLMKALDLNASVSIIDGLLVINKVGAFSMVISDRGCTYTLLRPNGDITAGGATKTFKQAFDAVLKWAEQRDA